MEMTLDSQPPSTGLSSLQEAVEDALSWADVGYGMGYQDRLEKKQQRAFEVTLVPELFRVMYKRGYDKAATEERQSQTQRTEQQGATTHHTDDGLKKYKRWEPEIVIRGCSLKEGLSQAFSKSSKLEGKGTMHETSDTAQENENETPKKGFFSSTWKYFAVGITAGCVGGFIGMTIGIKKGMNEKSSLSPKEDSTGAK